MKKYHLFLMAFLCSFLNVHQTFGQKNQVKDTAAKQPAAIMIGNIGRTEKIKYFNLKGLVKDTSTKIALANATVSILRTKDSVLLQFCRTDTKGNFEFKNLPSGNHIILITYPNYADFVDVLETDADNNLGTIALITKAVALQNVIVHGGGSMRLRGDTIAFMADSFKVREGANVEELLRKLPGFQVNKKGEITAQGQKVEKILVDGEEFFGDDPTLATQNLNASAVKEVQVFDKKSDQANFTGVDDGQKTKTINLKLKDGAKHGYFGKINLGGGLPNRWENNAMINAFKDNRKISAFGIISNLGQTRLNWDDESKYGGGNSMEMGDDGNIYFQNNDNFTPRNIQGVPTTWQAGINYINKYNDAKNTLNGSYRYQKLNVDANTSTNTQYILPDTQYFNNQRSHTFNSKYRHKVNGSYDIQLDSSQSLKISFNATTGQNYINTDSYSEALTGSGVPVNQNTGRTNGNTLNQTANSNILWRKKLKKKGRTLSINFAENYNSSKTDGYLFSQTNFFSKGQLIESDTVDQKKTNNSNGLSLLTKITYTEPIGKKSIVLINYGYALNNNESKRLSFDRTNGEYKNMNSLYSNDYKFNIQTNTVGFGYKFTDKKLNFGFGTDLANNNWKQYNVMGDSTRKYNFSNIFPRANIQYKLGQYSHLGFDYSGYSQAPSLNQLQPILDNTNTLNVAIGNPNLKQAFNNNFSIYFNTYQVLTDRSIYLNLNYNPITNAFGTLDHVDSVGRKTYQTINVNGNYTFSAYTSYGFKLKKQNLNVRFGFEPNVTRQYNYINGIFNKSNTYYYNGSFNISKYVEKKYSVDLTNRLGINTSKTSIRPDIITQYWSGENELEVGIFLPWNLELNTDADYQWRQKTSAFDPNSNRFLWNARIEKKLFKNKEIKLGFKINDILNQNIGFSRNVTSNYVTQNNYDVLKRYWLITLNWNFNKGPKKDSD